MNRRSLLSSPPKRSVQVEVDGKTTKRKDNGRPVPTAATAAAAADRRPATESSPLGSSPPVGFTASWTKEGANSNVSPVLVQARGPQSPPSPAGLVVGTHTVASATSTLSEVPPEPLYVPQVPHDLEMAMYGAGTTPYKELHHAPRFTATDAFIQEPVIPAAAAAAATDVLAGPGWSSTTAGKQPSAMGFAFPASDASPKIEFGGELGSEHGNDHWTDADLSKFSAVFMGEQGRAWREAVEEDELL